MATTDWAHPAFRGKIGVHSEDITPPVGIYARAWGAAPGDVATGVHRPLMLTAVAFLAENGEGAPLVLLGMDNGSGRTVEVEARLRNAVLSEVGGDPSRLIFAPSHTHAGPSTNPEFAEKPGGEHIAAYIDQLEQALVTAVKKAIATAEPAILECATGWCDLAQNRDFLSPEDHERYLAGWNPEGKGDSTLLVGRITALSGRPLATLVNYACHPTVLAWQNSLASPDYVGEMREVVERETGCPAVFILGAAGDLAAAYQYVGDTEVADRHGRRLGYSVLATLCAMNPPGKTFSYRGWVRSGAPLAIWEPADREAIPGEIRSTMLEVDLPIRADFPEKAVLEEQLAAAEGDRVLQEQLRRKLVIRTSLGDGSTYRSRNPVWWLGGIVIVGLNNEIYSVFQQTVRAALPEKALFVATLVHHSRGYLPPRHLYPLAERHYAVWQTPFAADSLELLTDKVLRLLACS